MRDGKALYIGNDVFHLAIGIVICSMILTSLRREH
jgi:hypothetical protein